MVNRMFKEHIGRNIEVYVDNILVTSKEPEHHLDDLWETFVVPRRHKMKLNSTKYAFDVDSSKFMSFMVSDRGIDQSFKYHSSDHFG